MESYKMIESRTSDLRTVLAELEKRRDQILDEVAFKKGQASLIEEVIQNLYSRIKEIAQEEAKKIEAEDFAKKSRGVKTPRRKRRDKNAKD